MKALISVYDKTGVVELARALQEAGYGLVSTGGTHRTLTEAGLSVEQLVGRDGLAGDAGRAREDAAPRGARRPAGPPRPARAHGRAAGPRHRDHRRAGGQPVPLRGDGEPGGGRGPGRAGEHRHRRADDAAGRGEEPPRGDGRRRPGGLRVGRRAHPRGRHDARGAAATGGNSLRARVVLRQPCRGVDARVGRTVPEGAHGRGSSSVGAAVRREPAPARGPVRRRSQPRWRGGGRAAARQGALIQQHPGRRRRVAGRQRVLRAGGGGDQAHQPVRAGRAPGPGGGVPAGLRRGPGVGVRRHPGLQPARDGGGRGGAASGVF